MNIQKFADKLEEKLNKQGIYVRFSNLEEANSRPCSMILSTRSNLNPAHSFSFLEFIDRIAPGCTTLEEAYHQLKKDSDKKDALEDMVKLSAKEIVDLFYSTYILDAKPVFISKEVIADDMFHLSFNDFFDQPISGNVDFEVAFTYGVTYITNKDVEYMHLDDPKEIAQMLMNEYKEGRARPSYDTFKEISIFSGRVEEFVTYLQNFTTEQIFAIPNSCFIACSHDLTKLSDMKKAAKYTYQTVSPHVDYMFTYPVSSNVYLYDGKAKALLMNYDPDMDIDMDESELNEDEEIEEEI